MTPEQLATQVRKDTFTTVSSYSNDKLLADANSGIRFLAAKMQKVVQSSLDTPATMNLDESIVSREYALPADMLNSMSKLELVLDGKRVTATNIGFIPTHPMDEATIISMYRNDAPRYFIRRGAIFILSGSILSTVPDGFILTYSSLPHQIEDITLTTYSIARPLSQIEIGIPVGLHDLLARYICVTYKARNGQPLNALEQNVMKDIEEAIDNMFDIDTSMSIVVPLPDDGTDNGYDL